MKVKLILLSLIMLLTFDVAYSQILNIEKYRQSSDTFNLFVGNIGVGYTAKKQANRVQYFKASTQAGYLSKLHSYILISKLNINTVNNSAILSEGYIHYRMNFWRKDFLSFEQFNQLQYDAGKNLNERWVFGGAARFHFINNDRADLSFNVGSMYENEYWKGTEEILQNESLKATLHFTLKYKILENLYLYSITFYQSKFKTFLKPRLITDTSLKFNINSKLSLQSSYIATVDDAPIVDVAQYIYSIDNKLIYTF